MSSRLRRIPSVYRRDGLSGLAYRALVVAARAAGCHVEWFDLVKTVGGPGDHDALRPVWITDACDRRVESLSRLRPDPDTYRRRLGDGYRVAVVNDNEGDCAAFLWFADTSEWEEDGVVVPLRENEVWALDAVVRPDLRGQRIHSRLFLGSMPALRDMGYDDALSAIDCVNRASLSSASRRGAVTVGRVFMFRVGRRAWVWERGLAASRPTWTLARVPVRLTTARGDLPPGIRVG